MGKRKDGLEEGMEDGMEETNDAGVSGRMMRDRQLNRFPLLVGVR
jgi:hypothetical protein